MIYNTRDITTPKSGLVVYEDSYWICVDGDPTKALFYNKSPQCNRQKAMCEWRLTRDDFKGYTVSIVFVKIAFVPQQH